MSIIPWFLMGVWQWAMGLSGVPSTPAEELLQLSRDFCQAGVTVGELYTALMTEPKPREGAEIFYSLMLGVVFTRSILDGYFNPLVFWYQWEYPLTSKEIIFLHGI